jgi:hypothetical protein
MEARKYTRTKRPLFGRSGRQTGTGLRRRRVQITGFSVAFGCHLSNQVPGQIRGTARVLLALTSLSVMLE